jgi:cytochrome o ubiquinol oxidase operon protein cyoD
MKPINAYITGFVLSIGLTLASFGLLYFHIQSDHVFPSHELIVPILVMLAVSQLLVQLIFFLHLGQEDKPRWNSIAFAFAVFIVFVVVGGSLWIMNNLNHGQSSLEELYPAGDISPRGQDD